MKSNMGERFSNDFSFCSEVSALITQGATAQAKQRLDSRLCDLTHKPISRNLRVEFAKLLRRTRQPLRALQLLAKKRMPHELVEYAACLNMLGAQSEAIRVLSSTDKLKLQSQASTKSFIKGLLFMKRWNYERALIEFESCIRMGDQKCYENLVARHNYLSCQVVLQIWKPKAAKISLKDLQLEILKLKSELEEQRAYLLLGYTIDAEASLELFCGDIFKCLRLIESLLVDSRIEELALKLYARKWHVLAKLKTKLIDANTAISQLAEIRRQSQLLNLSETTRDCDLWISLIANNALAVDRIRRLTSFESFCERIDRSNEIVKTLTKRPHEATSKKSFSAPKIPEQAVAWSFENHTSQRSTLLEPYAGLLSFKQQSGAAETIKVAPGSAIHRLLLCLSRDAYRFISLGEAFEQCYPGEIFNPFSSPNKVHQLVQRLRELLEPAKVEIEGTEVGDRLHGAFGVKLEAVTSNSKESEKLAKNLKTLALNHRLLRVGVLNPNTLNVAEISKIWEVSPRQARRDLQLISVND